MERIVEPVPPRHTQILGGGLIRMKKVVGILSVLGMLGAGFALSGNDKSHEQDCQVEVLQDGSEFVRCNDGSTKLIALGARP